MTGVGSRTLIRRVDPGGVVDGVYDLLVTGGILSLTAASASGGGSASVALDDLTDVDLTGAAVGDGLVLGSGGIWVPGTASGGGTGDPPVTENTTTTAGQTDIPLGTADPAGLMVFRNGLLQTATTHYTVSGTTLTLLDPAVAGEAITVKYGFNNGASTGGRDNPVDDPPVGPNAADYEFGASDTVSLPAGWSMPNAPVGASYRERNGVGTIIYPASTAVQIIGIDQAITADATWDYACKVGITTRHNSYYETTMYLRDSVSGRLWTYSLDARAAAWKRWTSPTSWASEGFGYLPAGWPTGKFVYMRMVKVSATVIDLYYSDDGFNWMKVHTGDPSGWIATPTHIGWGGSSNTNTLPESYVRCEWWRRLA